MPRPPVNLSLPRGPRPYPAVILIHGCGGIGPNIREWSTWLVHKGYAAFALDSFTGRYVMARSLGPALPARLVARLSQSDLRPLLGRALPLITLDAEGRPHPMLCSYLELRAVSPTLLRLAIAARSGSARNLENRGVATLLVIEPEHTIYVKGRASGAPLLMGELARFELSVEDVSEDAAAEWEAGAGITSGLIYAPAPDLGSQEARAILAALRS